MTTPSGTISAVPFEPVTSLPLSGAISPTYYVLDSPVGPGAISASSVRQVVPVITPGPASHGPSMSLAGTEVEPPGSLGGLTGLKDLYGRPAPRPEHAAATPTAVPELPARPALLLALRRYGVAFVVAVPIAVLMAAGAAVTWLSPDLSTPAQLRLSVGLSVASLVLGAAAWLIRRLRKF